MRVERRTNNAVFNHAGVKVTLVRIGKCVMYTHISKSTNQNQRLCFKTLQQNLQIGTEKGRITAKILLHKIQYDEGK